MQGLVRSSCLVTGYSYPIHSIVHHAFTRTASLDTIGRQLNGGVLPPALNALLANMIYAEALSAYAWTKVLDTDALRTCNVAEVEWARIRIRKVREGSLRVAAEVGSLMTVAEGMMMVVEHTLGLCSEEQQAAHLATGAHWDLAEELHRKVNEAK